MCYYKTAVVCGLSTVDIKLQFLNNFQLLGILYQKNPHEKN